MIDAFAPRMEADALARYDTDLGILRGGASGIDAVYAQLRNKLEPEERRACQKRNAPGSSGATPKRI